MTLRTDLTTATPRSEHPAQHNEANQAILDLQDAVEALGLDSDLVAIGALAPADDDLLQRKGGAWANRTPAQVKADLGLVKGDVGLGNVPNLAAADLPVSTATQAALDAKQAADADLTTIGGLAPANDDVLQRKAGAWTNRTVGQLRGDLYPTTTVGTRAHAEGDTTDASGYASHAQGAYAAATRYGQDAQAGQRFTTAGDAQHNTFSASCVTTNATPKLATFNQDGSGTAALNPPGGAANVLTIPVNRAHQFRVSVVARRSDVVGDTAGWSFEGLIGRGSGSAAFVGTVDGRAWGAAGAAAWDVTLTVNTTDATNNYLAVTVTGEAAKTIRWVARIDTVEVG